MRLLPVDTATILDIATILGKAATILDTAAIILDTAATAQKGGVNLRLE